MHREHVRNRHPGRGLDLGVGVGETQVEARREPAPDGAFPGPHQADEHDRALPQTSLDRLVEAQVRRPRPRSEVGGQVFVHTPSYHAGRFPVTGRHGSDGRPCLRSPAMLERAKTRLERLSSADPAPFPVRDRRARRPRLCGDVRARDPRRAGAARDDGDDPGLAPAGQMSGGRFVALFLDMLAAERGAAANTLSAYRRDLDDYAAFLAAKRIDAAEVEPAAVRAYRGEPRATRAEGVVRRAPPLGGAAIPQVPLRRRLCGGGPDRDRDRAEARPQPAEGALRRGGRPAPRRRPRSGRGARRPAGGAAARPAHALPPGAALRQRLAGLRARGAAARRGAGRASASSSSRARAAASASCR